MPSHKKHFIFTGLTGLTLLVPVLFFFYGFRANVYRVNAIPFNIDEHGYALYYFRPNQPYKTFTATGNAREELETLKAMRLAVRKMIAENDTVTGIKIRFGETGSYNAFIEAFTLLAEEHVRFFGMDENTLWSINPSDAEKKMLENYE